MSRPSNMDRTGGHIHETGGAASERGLTATGLAYQAEGLAPGQLQGHTVDRMDKAVAVRRVRAPVPLHQPVEPQDGVAGGRRRPELAHGRGLRVVTDSS